MKAQEEIENGMNRT